jgi:hypothetical protein
VTKNQNPLKRIRVVGAVAAGFLFTALALTPSLQAQGQTWDNPNGQIGSLSRENLAKNHPPHPVDLTGTYLMEGGFELTPYPKLLPAAQRLYDLTRAEAAAGKTFNDVTGQCWPPGLPIVMTRVWPIHVIPMKTAIMILMNFENQVRWIYTDGRKHTDPDVYVPSYNGESIGHWEGETLVVDTRNIETYKHYIDRLVPLSDQFHVIERIRLIDQGDLEIEFRMTDSENWEGEWVAKKIYRRKEHVDFVEVHCLPNLNEGIPAMQDRYRGEPDKK